eukprot:snap_masked-scaffold619_size123246-processed-gene-0.18 protein:Tk05500 transcript:snap_masked-scaffold619_size123246-processed-gene-0.18-mRNA-1 annotation:"phenylalanyl-trna synthetase alpha chain b-like"
MELTERILVHLEQHGRADSLALAEAWSLEHQKVVGAIMSLECLDQVVESRIDALKRWELTDEGREVVKRGSHEAVVFQAVPVGSGVLQPELMQAVGADLGKVGFSQAMSAGWLRIDKSGGRPMVQRRVERITDQVQADLKLVAGGAGDGLAAKARDEYKKRKLLQETTLKRHTVSKGPKFTTRIEKAETELTPEMIASGSWQTANFKPYNFEALGIQPPAGHLHPLLKVRAEYRQIFLEMGFTEMPTNNFVESSFWNFDALFQPQQHPARDAQDTFFLSDPATSNQFPADYLERVRRVHSEGGHGSQGYRMDWKLDDAQKNVLRTHTTAVSARMLYQLAQGGEFKPVKYFSIDRVFRNETLDATHLAEFHQIEGVIADYGITLGNLVGILYEFFKKLGIEELRFKPAYNPYTEPSMEVFSYHKGLKKWVEIGNSGLFRPEMLLPMGLPEGVNVIGYGLSLESLVGGLADEIQDSRHKMLLIGLNFQPPH